MTQPGRQCHTVEVSGPSTPGASRQACVTAPSAAPRAETAPPTRPPTPAEQPAPPPTERPSSGAKSPLSVSVTGPPQSLAVSESARFVIDVKNAGSVAFHRVKVVVSLDDVLKPKVGGDMWASGGYQWEGNDLVWSIDTLPAGESTQFGIVSKCQGPAPAPAAASP